MYVCTYSITCLYINIHHNFAYDISINNLLISMLTKQMLS